MSNRRTETWLLPIAVGIALIPVALAGLWGYMTVSATPLHPDPKDVRSVTHSAPLPQWAGAVEQRRRIVRAGLTPSRTCRDYRWRLVSMATSCGRKALAGGSREPR